MSISWAGVAWAISTAYAAADRVVNAGGVYRCTAAGTSASSGPGPNGTDPNTPITDGSCTWAFLGADAGPVTGIAPELSTTSVLVQRSILDEVDREVPINTWGAMRDDGAKYLAAHLGTLTRLKGKGPVTAEAVGQMSRAYASMLQFGMLALTGYGVEYLRKIRLLPTVAFGEVF